MSSRNLENLARIGSLKREAADPREIAAFLRSATERLRDATRTELSFASRFDLGYNAAHSIALAALRAKGYRSEARYLVFQCLQDTLGMSAQQCTLLSRCHQYRNIAEYEGDFEVDEPLLAAMLAVTKEMLQQAKVAASDSSA